MFGYIDHIHKQNVSLRALGLDSWCQKAKNVEIWIRVASANTFSVQHSPLLSLKLILSTNCCLMWDSLVLEARRRCHQVFPPMGKILFKPQWAIHFMAASINMHRRTLRCQQTPLKFLFTIKNYEITYQLMLYRWI